jgi:hypothetical protein
MNVINSSPSQPSFFIKDLPFSIMQNKRVSVRIALSRPISFASRKVVSAKCQDNARKHQEDKNQHSLHRSFATFWFFFVY